MSSGVQAMPPVSSGAPAGVRPATEPDVHSVAQRTTIIGLPVYGRRVVDWQRWHDEYADSGSVLSRRLAVVQQRIRAWADARPAGPLRILSICAGQGHDVAGALHDHPRRSDLSGVLVELDSDNVDAANRALAAAGLGGVRAVVDDAGGASAYRGAVPADLVLVCGVFGNVPDDDVRATVEALPGLCARDATVVWTRHRRDPDLTPAIRRWFEANGYAELDFTSPGDGGYGVGTHLLVVEPSPYDEDVQLFEFER